MRSLALQKGSPLGCVPSDQIAQVHFNFIYGSFKWICD